MQKSPETLGDILKKVRQSRGITIEALADQVGISARYLYKIENEGKIPSFAVLYKLVRVLSMSADLIFYPEKPSKDSEAEDLIRELYDCDDRTREIVKATARAIIRTSTKKQP